MAKNRTQVTETEQTETVTEAVQERKTRQKETRPSNVVFSEKAGNRLRLFEYQLDALVQQCRGRVARPTMEQFAWLQEYLRGKIEAAITAIQVELQKEAQESASERGNVAVPI